MEIANPGGFFGELIGTLIGLYLMYLLVKWLWKKLKEFRGKQTRQS